MVGTSRLFAAMKKTAFAILILVLSACSTSPKAEPSLNSPTSMAFPLPAEWTVTPTAVLTRAATPASPTVTPVSTIPQARMANGMSALPPSDADLKNLKSIWTLTRFVDLPGPESMDHVVTVTRSSTWLWDLYFCAVAENFLGFMTSVKVEFRVEVQLLKETENLRIYDSPGAGGWVCRNWVTKLSDWPVGMSVNLEIHYSFLRPVFDGNTRYPAGEYYQQISVFVKE
jgi:hypothetical protein